MNHRIFLHAAAAVLTLTSPVVWAGDGALDPNYGGGGRVRIPFDLAGDHSDQAFGAALQSDGRLVVVGTASIADSATGVNKDVAVTRLRANGIRDYSFGTLGKFTYNFNFPGFCNNADVANAVTIQSDGKILVVGSASCNPGGSNVADSLFVMRLLANGTLDSSFGSGGVAVQWNANYSVGGTAVTLFGNYIIAAGYVDYPNGTSGPVFWVFNGTGQLVTVDGPIVADAGSKATSVSVDPFGDVTLSGYYKTAAAGPGHTNGYDCFIIRRVPNVSTGIYGADNSFGTGGMVHLAYDFDGGADNDYCFAHAVGPDGKIVIVGQAGKAGGGSYATVHRMTSSGGDDFTFNNAGLFFFEDQVNYVNAFNVARAVGIRPDNRIVIAGYGHVPDSTRAPFDFGVVRLNADGTDDQSFQGSELGSRPGLAMFGFETTNAGTDDGAFAMALDKANRPYVVGQHYEDSVGTYNMAIARLQSDAIFVDGFESP